MEPQMNADGRGSRRVLPIDELTEIVIGYAFKVHNTLGCGFLEKVYVNAIAVELRKADIKFIQQADLIVRYEGVVVGDYTADLYIDDRLIVELKAVKNFDESHLAQAINYLKATDHRVGLLFNFAKPKLDIKRVVNNY